MGVVPLMPKKAQNPYQLTAMELAVVRQALNQTEEAWKIGINTLVQFGAAEMKRAQRRKLELLRSARDKIVATPSPSHSPAGTA